MQRIDTAKILHEVSEHELDINNFDIDMKELYRDGKPFVSIEQFIDDDYYFGKVGKDLWPDNRPDLLDIFDPRNNYIEIILTGATSIGKTFLTCISLAYMMGQLGHYVDPHRTVGASPTSPIVFINMSVSAQKAKSVIYNRTKTMIDSSPYFREQLKRDPNLSDTLIWRIDQDRIKSKTGPSIEFHPGTSESLSALGEDVYGGVIDEANFFRVIEKSKMARDGVHDRAKELYNTIKRRIMGRFSVMGLTLGKLFLLSSSQYPDDFIEVRIREAEESGELGNTIKVVRKSTWDARRGVTVQGKPVFSDKTFRVEVGSSRKNSRILDKYDKDTGKVTEVITEGIEGKIQLPPIELWDDYYRDVEGAVRDFGGDVTRAIAPFFHDVSVLYDAIELAEGEELIHPWTKEETTLKDGSKLLVDKLFIQDPSSGKWQPRRHPGKARYFGIDLGETGDPAGIAVVHIGGWKQVITSQKEVEVKAIYETDLMLRVIPEGRIDFAAIRAILYLLRQYGMYIRFGSYDQYQSAGEIQILNSQGIETEKRSDDISQYLELREAFFERRMIMYNYLVILEELSQLEKKKDKVDHPPEGHNDVSNALAHAVYNAFEKELRASPEMLRASLPHMGKRVKRQSLKAVMQREEAVTMKQAGASPQVNTPLGTIWKKDGTILVPKEFEDEKVKGPKSGPEEIIAKYYKPERYRRNR